MSENILCVKNIKKSFGGVHALKGVDLTIKKGETHCLAGENGCGKSTIIKVISGFYKPDEGTIEIDGKEYTNMSTADAIAAGIQVIYQDFSIFPNLTVMENLAFNQVLAEKKKFVNKREFRKIAEEAVKKINFDVDLDARVETLPVADKQLIAISRALLHNAKLIIMDEPTSSLGKEEIEQLMETVRGLKAKGVAILFVSHKLEELFELCDRVTVMRDGEHIITEDTVNLTEDSLINAMVGRTLDNLYPKEFGTKGEVWLEAKGLNEAGVLHDVSFKAHAGQITGFAGLVGAGRTETMRAVFGADKLDSGEIYVKGEKVHIRTPKDAIKRKIAFLTEDRKGQGLVLNLDVRTNLVLANMKGFSNGPFLDKDRIEQAGNDNVSALKIKTPSLNEVVGQLSGGNQQKVVIGKWVNTDADIFIFDEPTRGIDVGAKIEVYRVMNDLVKAGKCVIMVSSELPEILAMSDHVVVMRGGRVMADIDRDTPHFNSEDIMKAAWGGELD